MKSIIVAIGLLLAGMSLARADSFTITCDGGPCDIVTGVDFSFDFSSGGED